MKQKLTCRLEKSWWILLEENWSKTFHNQWKWKSWLHNYSSIILNNRQRRYFLSCLCFKNNQSKYYIVIFIKKYCSNMYVPFKVWCCCVPGILIKAKNFLNPSVISNPLKSTFPTNSNKISLLFLFQKKN